MRVVLDTSILVAAWRSNRGASFEVLRLLRRRRFEIAISVPLVLEYESALLRNLTGDLTAEDAEDLVDYLCSVGVRQEIFFLWRPLLTDPDDDMVVEVAIAARCRAVVTHNRKDFAAVHTLGLDVLAPAEFLTLLTRS